MDRRDFLGAVSILPALAGMPAESKSEDKLQQFSVRIGDISSASGYLEPSQARTFLLDSTRDMATVLGQGKKFAPRDEPDWLTQAADRGIKAAMEESRQRDIAWHKHRLLQLEKS